MGLERLKKVLLDGGNMSLIDINELKEQEISNIKKIVFELDEYTHPTLINNKGYTLKEDILKVVLDKFIYSNQNIPEPSKQQIASWNRLDGVTIERVAYYISNQKREKDIITGKV